MSQNTFVMPIVGPKTMAEYSGLLNDALKSINEAHAGTTAPANGPVGAPWTYQLWADTTSNPTVLKMYEGTSWVVIGAMDTSGHLWMPGNGQIRFPATQNPSADANTLDDYEEFTWTPALSFATMGDASIVHSVAAGSGIKIGSKVEAWFNIATSTNTHTTASGNLQITGLPFAGGASAGGYWRGLVRWSGITLVGGQTQVNATLGSGSSIITFGASGSGVASGSETAADVTSGGTLTLSGQISYRV